MCRIGFFAKKPKAESPKMKTAQVEDKTESKEQPEVKDESEQVGGEKISRSSPVARSESKG